MNCNACGTQLPPTAKVCPKCGTPTPSYYYGSGASPYESTVQAAPYNVAQQSPPTSYGSQPYNPYGPPQQNPYEYNMPSVPPPPPNPPRRSNRTGIIIGSALLLLILIGGGVFVLLRSSANSTPSGLTSAQSTATASTVATATAIVAQQNPYPPFGGTLVLNDSMSDNSKGYKWDTGTFADGGSCGFTGGAYHVGAAQNGFSFSCNPEAVTLSDFAFQVQMKIIKGDQGGVDFRQNNTSGLVYYFFIGTNGSYELFVSNGKTNTTLKKGSSSSIKTGLNQTNLIGVVAKGSSIDVYVNLMHVDGATDNSTSQGLLGVSASATTMPSEAVFSNAKAWKL
nr:zinc ribbon domain-containing protein [Ktedonobacteraceae bacterium]